MTSNHFPTEPVREALDGLPETMAATTEQPDPKALYVVQGHERALDPDTTVVVGDRGTGKSFWSAALNGPITRRLIASQLPRLRLETVKTSWGFSVSTRNADHPSRRVLQHLLRAGFGAEDIWRAVIIHQLMNLYREPLPGDSWADRVRYVIDDPEREEGLLNDISGQLANEGQRHLIVFDALDRTGNDWKSIRNLVRGLLQVCLDLKGTPGVQPKLFMRPDMWEDQTIWQFRDSSKLHHGRVILEWRRADLYGLLWHWLTNHDASGAAFRERVEKHLRFNFGTSHVDEMDVHTIPKMLRRDEGVQADLLNDMATRYMGRNRRRGRTYTWLPNHLADAKGLVSPRSFLVAVREAQRETVSRGHEQVLHWEGIKKGVQDASRIRLQELQEDYPWIDQVLAPLKGLTVPCADEDVLTRWRNENVIETVREDQKDALQREKGAAGDDSDEGRFFLPPHALESAGSKEQEEGLMQELVRIGVVRRLTNERVDIPDLFRVAAAIGRRGGVRPIR